MTESFLESLLEPSQPAISPTRLADTLHMDVSELAGLARVRPETITEDPQSPQLQDALREMVEVLVAAYHLNNDREQTVRWFLAHPIADFHQQTAAELVQLGKARAVINYIESIAAGATG